MVAPVIWIILCVCFVIALILTFRLVVKKRHESEKPSALATIAAEAIRQNGSAYSGLYQGMYRLARSDWRAWERWLNSMAQRTKLAFGGSALAQRFENEQLPKTREEAEELAKCMLEGAQIAGIRLLGLNEMFEIEDSFVTSEGDAPDPSNTYILVSPAFVLYDIVLEKGVVKQ